MAFNSNYPYALKDGETISSGALESITFKNPMIYEVIRVVDGKPLFYQDHMTRLKTSARLLGQSLDSIETALEQGVRKLISQLEMNSDNIKIVIGNLESAKPSWLMFGVKGFYPPVQWYEQGIKTTLIHEARENPHAKVVNASLAERVDQLRATTDYFEALLVDEEQRITEGSRSNVVFVQGNRLVMPKSELALKGITKEKLIQAAELIGVEWKEADIRTTDLPDLDGVFITGTSIDLLPIAEIDSYTFATSSNPVMKQLLEQYRLLMKTSLDQFKM